MKDEAVISLHRRNSAEENRKMKERALWASPEMKRLRENMQRRHGLDIRNKEKFKAGLDGWSWSKFIGKVMQETNNASSQAQLLRAGIQTAVNNLYTAVETTYEEWAHVISSSRDTELYAPLNASSFFSELGEGEKYSELNVVGLDIKLRNKKLGGMLPVTVELIEDDQTGQFQQKVSEMAEYAALVWEVYAYGKLQSPTGGCSYGPILVPTSETKPSTESNYPWTLSSAKFVGGGWNKATAAALSDTTLKAAITQLHEQLNLQGLKMNVKPRRAIVSPYNEWTLATLLNSSYYPGGAQAAGVTGGALSINTLKGILQATVSKFVFDNANPGSSANSKAWYVVDDSKPFFIVQLREAATVTQEDPNSGASFERDLYRWKCRVRGNSDWIDPRFAFQGNDGSA